MKKIKISFVGLIVIAIVAGVSAFTSHNKKPGKFDIDNRILFL